jgi:hypothetical protein
MVTMKKLTIGIIIGFILAFSTNAIAAIGDTVQAVFAQFTYVVNGETKTLDTPVLVHEGNSYLRTTQISNMLGYDVTYKADTRTIVFTNPEVTTIEPAPVESGTVDSGGVVQDGGTVDQPSEPNPSPEPTPETTPTPAPDNTAACQQIKDDYAYQIAMVSYSGGNNATKGNKILQLEYERDQALSAAGCN